MALKHWIIGIGAFFLLCYIVLTILVIAFGREDTSTSKISFENNLTIDVRNIVNNVTPKFIYNITDDSIILNDSELFSRGGDCLDWSRYYTDYFKDDYDVKIVVIGSENPKHAIAIISDKSKMYCIIDQTNYYCS